MDTFRRLLNSTVGTFSQNRPRGLWDQHWLLARKVSLGAWKRSEKARSWMTSRPNLAFAPVGVFGVIYLLWIQQAAAAATLAGAWFALARSFAQSEADRRRRIMETYSKAVTQLASDKLEERLGGIYTLENISKESPGDYWTVMETLTAFVRERSRRNEADRTALDVEQRVSRRAYFLWREAGRPNGQAEEFWAKAARQDEAGGPPAADIATVLTVIQRRSERNRERANSWNIDLSGAVLKQVDCRGWDLEWVNLSGANLCSAKLNSANLSNSDFSNANLRSADLSGASLSGAYLINAQLTEAKLNVTELSSAHLEQANLNGAHLGWAGLSGTHLEGADLGHVTGLTEAQLAEAHGDAATRLPDGIARPAPWPGAIRN